MPTTSDASTTRRTSVQQRCAKAERIGYVLSPNQANERADNAGMRLGREGAQLRCLLSRGDDTERRGTQSMRARPSFGESLVAE
ncbi:MAG: hypothetical protein DCC68_01945 [Planctomycetota bacterium]|nr:MAG: hypothetical protein DCC68_01945 [Planctomycetota bacterium]